MPVYVNGATAECFECKARANIRVRVVPSLSRPPAVPKGWAYFRRVPPPEDDDHDVDVFCPKHHPTEGWVPFELL